MKIETMRKPGAILGIAVIDVGTLARNWWVVLLRGVAGIIFGHSRTPILSVRT